MLEYMQGENNTMEGSSLIKLLNQIYGTSILLQTEINKVDDGQRPGIIKNLADIIYGYDTGFIYLTEKELVKPKLPENVLKRDLLNIYKYYTDDKYKERNKKIKYLEINIKSADIPDIETNEPKFTADQLIIPQFSKRYYINQNVRKKDQRSISLEGMGIDIDKDDDQFPKIDDKKYIYISRLEHAVNQIEKFIWIIKHNIGTLENHLKLKYLYEIHHKIITEIIHAIINIYQYMLFANGEKEYIIEKTSELKEKFNKQIDKDPGNKFVSTLEAALESYNKVYSNTESIYTNFNKLYTQLYGLHTKLNDVLSVLDKHSGVALIENYFKKFNTNELYDMDLSDVPNKNFNINNTYDRLFSGSIPSIPENLDSYISLHLNYDIFNKDSLNKLKKTLYEKYIPYVNKNNYQTYHSNVYTTNQTNKNVKDTVYNNDKKPFAIVSSISKKLTMSYSISSASLICSFVPVFAGVISLKTLTTCCVR